MIYANRWAMDRFLCETNGNRYVCPISDKKGQNSEVSSQSEEMMDDMGDWFYLQEYAKSAKQLEEIDCVKCAMDPSNSGFYL